MTGKEAATAMDAAAELYGRMALIREFEQAAYRAYERNELPGTIHASIGQEGVAVGVVAGLRGGDRMLSHHRGHGHALAKGVEPSRLMAELFGRATGVCGGHGGSMHVADVEHGFLGSLAVVGGSVPLALGAALAAARRNEDAVCAVFFGDGAVNQGVLYESMNLAVMWRLAVLFVCENNGYAITTPADRVIAGDGIAARARAFGLEARHVDGQDVEAVRDATRALADGARAGRPALLECATYRFLGHSRSDPAYGNYRTREEVMRWRERDPLVVLRERAGLDARLCASLETHARARVEEALAFARASPEPSLEDLERDVWGEPPGTRAGAAPTGEAGPAETVTFAEAIRCALEDAMAEDETLVLLGQDIGAGFPFGVTRGLRDLYGPERVRDTPISEAATMGCATGASMLGVRTVIEVDFAGFLLLGSDQLVNNAAKLRYMSGGQLRVPLVVRAGQGPLGAFAAQHSQSQHAWLANVPGLALCAPADPQDAYELMRWALCQRDPVVFAEDMRLYRRTGQLRREPRGETPRARVLRPGRDASAVSYGFGSGLALAAAAELANEGIELEVLDLRLLSPLDETAIGESARHTGRVLCIGDDPLLGGITGTLAAVVEERAHGALTAPVGRLGARHLPTPFGPGEAHVYPSIASTIAAVRKLVAWPRDRVDQILDGELALAPDRVG